MWQPLFAETKKPKKKVAMNFRNILLRLGFSFTDFSNKISVRTSHEREKCTCSLIQVICTDTLKSVSPHTANTSHCKFWLWFVDKYFYVISWISRMNSQCLRFDTKFLLLSLFFIIMKRIIILDKHVSSEYSFFINVCPV